jgi:hypothetical protein
MIRYILLVVLTGILSCNEPEPEKTDYQPRICYSPEFYTDFDISEMDSAMLTGTSRYYMESLPPYFVKIEKKEFHAKEQVWSFTLEDSLCNSQLHYFTLKSKNDSVTYDYGLPDGETIYLMNDEARKRFDSLVQLAH